MANVIIDIATEFTGKKAFKQAETSVDKLNATTKNLGRTLNRTLGTAAIVAFGRASVKAFAEDDKAATSLGQTLKNLNLAYGSNIGTVNGYISRLEAQTGVLDDELRPAMDRLLRATGSVTQAQDLLNLSLDIAAGTGKSVTQVSQSLQKAFLGQTQALGRLGVGLTRAELTSSSFEEIQQRLTTLFAGQAQAAADTFAGRLDKLTIAANNAKETIGKGLYDAITALSGGGATAATDNIDKLAKGIADSLKNTGEFINRLEDLKPVLIAVGVVAAAAFFPVTTAIAGAILLMSSLNKEFKKADFAKGIIPGGMGNISMTVSGQVDNRVLKNQSKVTKLTKEQAAAQAKILKDKKLSAAIDKANLLLGKGENVFDIDKIQLNAALINQAQLLGKATDAAQMLQIANDTARLRVKQSIAALEDAIAAKDEAAIIAATAKLNEDLKILGALTNQKTQMVAIESILKGLTSKDLINQNNLDEALRKIREMLALLAQVKPPTLIPDGAKGGTPSDGGVPKGGTPDEIIKKLIPDEIIKKLIPNDGFLQTPDGIKPLTKARTTEEINKAVEDLGGVVTVIGENGKEFSKLVDGAAAVFQTIEDVGAFNALVNSFASGTINSFSAGTFRAAEGGSLFNSGAVGSRDKNFNITVNTGVGDPNAIAEAISNVLREAQDRGTLTIE
jgi:hypothetical protein